MKLRYYLRGLGIGILVTALIMGMTSKAGRPLTDSEIRAKALTLGMVDPENMNLSNLGGASAPPTRTPGQKDESMPSESPDSKEGNPSEDPNGQETENPSESPDSQETETPLESPSPQVTETQTASPTPTISPIPQPTPTLEPTAEAEAVTILIVRGDSSYTVSRRLEEAGLIESAREYDIYLVENGYSTTIRTGTYRIPMGSTWEEIAHIIA